MMMMRRRRRVEAAVGEGEGKLKYHQLYIQYCPELSLILGVPSVEEVKLEDVNEKLRVRGADMEMEKKGGGWPTCSSNSVLRTVRTSNVRCIESLPSINELRIGHDEKVERLEEVRELWGSFCSSSLRFLSIYNCSNLTLTQEAEAEAEAEGKDIAGDDPCCPPVLQSLRSLQLLSLPKLVNLPEWMKHLTSLQSLEICRCESLESLPDWMPHLTALQELLIEDCPNLTQTREAEAEAEAEGKDIAGDDRCCPPFLQSLRSLHLVSLPKLVNLPEWMQHLTSLQSLCIGDCEFLESLSEGMPRLTALQELGIVGCPNLTPTQEAEGKDIAGDDPCCPPFLQSLRSLTLVSLPKLVNLPEWMQHLTSLRSLSIVDCKSLESLPEWMPHLTALQELHIQDCPNPTLTQEAEGKDIAGDDPCCPPFLQSLRCLRLYYIPQLVNLPEWMQHLTSLQSLIIFHCESLESLPEWMPRLTSLTHLQICSCSKELEQRCCKSPAGQDWPYIRHIPDSDIYAAYSDS